MYKTAVTCYQSQINYKYVLNNVHLRFIFKSFFLRFILIKNVSIDKIINWFKPILNKLLYDTY